MSLIYAPLASPVVASSPYCNVKQPLNRFHRFNRSVTPLARQASPLQTYVRVGGAAARKLTFSSLTGIPSTVDQYQKQFALSKDDVNAYKAAITWLVGIHSSLHDQASHYQSSTTDLIVDLIEPFMSHGYDAKLYYGALYAAVSTPAAKAEEEMRQYGLTPSRIVEIVANRFSSRFTRIIENAKDAIADVEKLRKALQDLRSDVDKFDTELIGDKAANPQTPASPYPSRSNSDTKKVIQLQKDVITKEIDSMIRDLGEAVDVLKGIQVEVEELFNKFKKIRERLQDKKWFPPGYLVPDQEMTVNQWKELGNVCLVKDYIKTAQEFKE
ncbi:hypothetical protein F5887DRAFT_916629 [Amanita rubescens]|nr:hypothetical protein F5887DRAFT_916629 [Amanita rubescens]